ncbi:MAG: hypothetical protein QF415_02305 [Candidatus Undinarchaeales archaeon]|jgi:hypothetical protein|nr:hypothetical protein [Candidatus Undinarchaeales archaeon]MDP7492236.1 hypothetical protein [Candidatus Undinarchaeales archaeon]
MLPIKKVVLYKHGVGYFERAGKVKGSQQLTFTFRQSEINDVLKSFTFLDSGKGAVTSISYDAFKPVAKALEEVSFRLDGDENLTELVGQLKGAEVEVSTGGKTLTATVTGIQTRTVVENDREHKQRQLMLLDDVGKVRTVPLEEIAWLRPTDETLARELRFYLDTVFAATRRDKKTVTVYTKGKDSRDVACAYVVECPVWKTSYRLLVDDKGKITLQGWAIVDNVMDDDWKSVDLSLVAGLPVSFRNDLYSPRYAFRPEIAVKLDMGVRPMDIEEAMEGVEDYDDDEEFDDEKPCKKVMEVSRMMMRSRPAPAPPPRAQMAKDSFKASAVGRDMGEVFAYDVAEPVTVLRNQSALVPILQQEVSGKKILVYNEAGRADNPMACLKLTNDTGLALEEGPATVLDKGTYVGETMLPFLKKDGDRTLSYAVELRVKVTKEERYTGESIQEVQVESGALVGLSYRKKETIYYVKDTVDKEVPLFIEHPKENGYEITSEIKPTEETENYRRFELSLKPKTKAIKLMVSERKLERTRIYVRNMSTRDVTWYYDNSLITQTVADEIRAILELYRKITRLDEERQKLDEERNRIFEHQTRYKDNLSSLGTSSSENEVRQMYVSKLKVQETRIEEIEARFETLEKDKEKIQTTINERSAGLVPLARKDESALAKLKRLVA